MQTAELLTQLKQDIDDVYAKSYTKGETKGEEQGYSRGYGEGQKAEYDKFWDAFQQNGERTNYYYAFVGGNYYGELIGGGWTDETFKPKYDMQPSIASRMFCDSAITDIVASLERQGVTIDFSKTKSFNDCLNGAISTTFPKIDMSSAANFHQGFRGASKLKSAHLVNIKQTQHFYTAFESCADLENIILEGVVENGLDFHWSPKLTNESVQSIIGVLADLTDKTALTLTLHADVKANLTEEQIAQITSKNWTLA